MEIITMEEPMEENHPKKCMFVYSEKEYRLVLPWRFYAT
jgi:hypothetical protein